MPKNRTMRPLRRRPLQFRINFDSEERAALEAYAARRGLTLADAVRQWIRSTMTPRGRL